MLWVLSVCEYMWVYWRMPDVTCACGAVITFDEETLEEGSIVCENCGETLEFSFDDEDEDED